MEGSKAQSLAIYHLSSVNKGWPLKLSRIMALESRIEPNILCSFFYIYKASRTSSYNLVKHIKIPFPSFGKPMVQNHT